MIALPEERFISKVLEEVKKEFPALRYPAEDEIHFFDKAGLWGLGGETYGIGFNVSITSSFLNFVGTILHELVHYQGIRGHGNGFNHLYKQLTDKINKLEHTKGLFDFYNQNLKP